MGALRAAHGGPQVVDQVGGRPERGDPEFGQLGDGPRAVRGGPARSEGGQVGEAAGGDHGRGQVRADGVLDEERVGPRIADQPGCLPDLPVQRQQQVGDLGVRLEGRLRVGQRAVRQRLQLGPYPRPAFPGAELVADLAVHLRRPLDGGGECRPADRPAGDRRALRVGQRVGDRSERAQVADAEAFPGRQVAVVAGVPVGLGEEQPQRGQQRQYQQQGQGAARYGGPSTDPRRGDGHGRSPPATAGDVPEPGGRRTQSRAPDRKSSRTGRGCDRGRRVGFTSLRVRSRPVDLAATQCPRWPEGRWDRHRFAGVDVIPRDPNSPRWDALDLPRSTGPGQRTAQSDGRTADLRERSAGGP
ncbi:hypothetical protein B0E53_04708 [Micromonospora sp. MH33]|nr:hypothetical protein B0E53_04708 [Micromonospora sp. MH33]